MSALRMEAVGFEPVVLRFGGGSRAAVPELRDGVEHVRDAWSMSRLQASVAMDIMSPVPRVVAARRLVRDDEMTGRIQHLPALTIEGHQSSGSGTSDHPMRIATRRAAGLDASGWTAALRGEVADYFDGLADEWHTRASPERTAIVVDALSRGLDPLQIGGGLAVEVGSGIGTYSRLIGQRFPQVLAVDLSLAMLQRAPSAPAHRVQADAARLPIRDGAAIAIVLINAFLFPAEVERVLSPAGALVWVNSSGDSTPIHLSPDDLVAALPGMWTGVASQAGLGIWCVLRRG